MSVFCLQIVRSLLDRVQYQHWRESLLVSISMDRDDISELMIGSKEYENYKKLARDSEEPLTTRSKFPAAITPLILAAGHNQYGIVKLLLEKGERIPVPHHAYCVCSECKDALLVTDELEIAKDPAVHVPGAGQRLLHLAEQCGSHTPGVQAQADPAEERRDREVLQGESSNACTKRLVIYRLLHLLRHRIFTVSMVWSSMFWSDVLKTD